MASNPVGLGWRLRNSWWVLLVVLGVGCLSGTGFLYIGLTAKRPAWWGTGVAYLVLSWSCLVAINRLGETRDEASTAVAVAYFALWFAGIVHALVWNGAWLRWRAAHRAWYDQPAAQPLAPPPVFAPVAPPPVAPPPVALPPVALPPVAASAVEINSASAELLAAAARIDPARAQRAVAARESGGGFQTVEEFAAAAGLAPHEFARARAALTCVPRPRALQQQPQPPAGGRVLDF